LVNGEGAGALLAAAAGDVAGGASSIGYSACLQQATIVSYHLLNRDAISAPDLATEWAELGADGTNPSVYRAPTADFEEWLALVNTPDQRRVRVTTCEPAVRSFPVGVWFRRRPEELVTASLAVSRLTHMDATTAVASAALAGATAACAFGQTGRDLLAAAEEIARMAAASVKDQPEGFIDAAAAGDFLARIRRLRFAESPDVGKAFDWSRPEPGWVIAAIKLASDQDSEPSEAIASAASFGGSPLGSMVGALVGARVGLRPWPWTIPNSTWFAELGVRLVSGNRETRDLPVPYYVEETLTHGIERDYRRPF